MMQLKELCELNTIISLTKYMDLPQSHVWTVKYFTEETADKKPLLIVHGGPGIPHNYLLSLKMMAQYRPVIFYDQGGCGTSTLKDRPKFNMAFFLGELEALCDALKLRHHHFFGHSWGSALGIEYALAHKNRLKSLTLASPLISGDLWTKDMQHVTAQMPIAVQNVLRHHEKVGTLDDPEYIKARTLQSEFYVCRIKPTPEVLQYSLDHVNKDIYAAMAGPYRLKLTGSLASYDRLEDLKRIPVPTLITCGKYDISVPATMQQCVDKLPSGVLQVFANSSHMAHLEETTDYVYKLEQFLRIHD